MRNCTYKNKNCQYYYGNNKCTMTQYCQNEDQEMERLQEQNTEQQVLLNAQEKVIKQLRKKISSFAIVSETVPKRISDYLMANTDVYVEVIQNLEDEIRGMFA